jgi:very-short-patch-repair endonuclease
MSAGKRHFAATSSTSSVSIDGSLSSWTAISTPSLEQAAHDAIRDQVLRREGFQTLRFWNRAVHEDIDAVMDVICHALEAASPTRPLRGHPPHEGEGGS